MRRRSGLQLLARCIEPARPELALEDLVRWEAAEARHLGDRLDELLIWNGRVAFDHVRRQERGIRVALQGPLVEITGDFEWPLAPRRRGGRWWRWWRWW